MRERLVWIDVVKILGIFAIYVGHFGQAAGNLYDFVFAFHVPLFFFVAGLFAATSTRLPWPTFLMKKARELLLPFVVFTLLYLAVVVLQGNLGAAQIRPLLMPLALGIRNESPTMTLWFLPCLFIVAVIFDVLLRLRFGSWALLAACTASWAVAEWLLPHRPVVDPSWAFNLDSALYYILFYAIGAVVFPWVRTTTAAPMRRPARALVAVSLVLSSAFAVALYLGRDPLDGVTGEVVGSVKIVLYALVLIYLTVAAGFALARFRLLARMGQETIFYCGNEVIIKTLVPVALGTVGLSVQLTSPLAVCLYVAALLVIAHLTVIRVESALLSPLMRPSRPRGAPAPDVATADAPPADEPAVERSTSTA